MKIEIGKPPERTHAVKPLKTGNNDKTVGAENKTVADKVVVSGEAREIAVIAGSVKTVPDVRQELVGQIKNRINSGSYVVDTVKIAGKIIDEAI